MIDTLAITRSAVARANHSAIATTNRFDKPLQSVKNFALVRRSSALRSGGSAPKTHLKT